MKEIYSKICRLCLQITNDLLPIHDSSDTICNTIMACTVIKISKDDGLPDNICTSCMQKLNSSYEFKQLCETSDVFLRNYDIGVDSVEFEPETVKDEEIIVVSPTVKDEVAISVKEEDLAEKTVSEQFEIIYAYSDTIEEIEADDSLVQYEPEPQPEPEPEQKVTEKPQIPDLLPIKKQKSGRKKGTKTARKKVSKQESSTECKICHKVFSHAGNMKRHALIHQGIKPHACHLCGKKFSRSSTLKEHLDIFHAKNIKEYNCKLCDFTNLRRNELSMHMVIEHNIGTLNSVKPRFSKPKPQTCTICNKMLSSTAALNMHMKIHNNVREHLCRHCGRAFHHKAGLENHERIHTGEKPYICPHCPKRFSQQIGLKIHERTHTGERPYQCKVCLKSFSQQTHLRTHSFTHSGERRYACDMCDKRFALREGLRYHQMAHTGETPFKCSLCNKGFYIQYKLKVHMAKSHHLKMEIIKK